MSADPWTRECDRARPGGSSTFEITYDDAWLWKDGRWQLTAWRSSRSPAPPPPSRSGSGARDTVLARFNAALRADVTALDALLADDLQYCNFQGECWSKQQYVDSVKSGALKYKSIEPTVEARQIVHRHRGGDGQSRGHGHARRRRTPHSRLVPCRAGVARRPLAAHQLELDAARAGTGEVT